MVERLDIPLPEITVEEFQRSWMRFELVASAKGWVRGEAEVDTANTTTRQVSRYIYGSW